MSPHIYSGAKSAVARALHGSMAAWQQAYRHWGIDTHDIALLYQQLACLVAELAHLVLGDGPTCAKLCDGSVEIAAADAHGAGAAHRWWW
jgi:hypothetical protein